MGRPIKSTWIGNSAGRIEVTGAFSTETTQPDGSGAEAVSTVTGQYISSQRSARRFYERNYFKKVGKIFWLNNKIEGVIYERR
jgi:hypothetical protein